MLEVTVQEMEKRAATLVRTVRDEQVEYLVLERGVPVAMLSPVLSAAPEKQDSWAAEAQILVNSWLVETEQDDEPSYQEFKAMIEQNRLDLRTDE